MARHRRLIETGQLIHSISRFVNGEFRIESDVERNEYLGRLGDALTGSDWGLIAYVIMSSHVHLLLVAGVTAFSLLMKGVHSGFSSWINRRQGRLGPVLADRPKTITVDPCRAPYLIAYLHNNPVRARVVREASECTWSSHGAYLGKSPCPRWLDVETGLNLAGFGSDISGRSAFDQFVREHGNDAQDMILSGGDINEERRMLRRAYRTAVEISYPKLTATNLVFSAFHSTPPWRGDLTAAIEQLSVAAGISPAAVRGPSRARAVVHQRKKVVCALRSLGRTQLEIGRALGISAEAVGRLERSAEEEMGEEAFRLAAWLRDRSG